MTALVAAVGLAIAVTLSGTTLAALLDRSAGQGTDDAADGRAFQPATALIADDATRGGTEKGTADRGISTGRGTLTAQSP